MKVYIDPLVNVITNWEKFVFSDWHSSEFARNKIIQIIQIYTNFESMCKR